MMASREIRDMIREIQEQGPSLSKAQPQSETQGLRNIKTSIWIDQRCKTEHRKLNTKIGVEMKFKPRSISFINLKNYQKKPAISIKLEILFL